MNGHSASFVLLSPSVFLSSSLVSIQIGTDSTDAQCPHNLFKGFEALFNNLNTSVDFKPTLDKLKISSGGMVEQMSEKAYRVSDPVTGVKIGIGFGTKFL